MSTFGKRTSTGVQTGRSGMPQSVLSSGEAVESTPAPTSDESTEQLVLFGEPLFHKNGRPITKAEHEQGKTVLFCIAAIVLFFVVYHFTSNLLKTPEELAAEMAEKQRQEEAASEEMRAARASIKPPLSVGRSKCSTSYGFTTYEGRVTNQSSSPIDNLMAVGIFADSNGEFIKSDSAMVEYQPLLPGQTSPWKVMTTDNPAIKKCHLEFKTMFGGKIAYD